jgi:hypothetical protein
VEDYRGAVLAGGRTLFLGNPPYVRHHRIGARWKAWLSRTARAHGFGASQLAGLHVHFFLATLARARPGDVGSFITAAEWLDVNYGRLVREILAGPLGLVRLDVVQPETRAFDDALTTAAIASFEIAGRAAEVRLRRVSAAALDPLAGGRTIARNALAVRTGSGSSDRTRRRCRRPVSTPPSPARSSSSRPATACAPPIIFDSRSTYPRSSTRWIDA